MQYVGQPKPPGCVFCLKPAEPDERAYVVHRGQDVYVILNAFPYNSGHLLVVPFVHESDVAALPAEAYSEMMLTTRTCVEVLRRVYRPDGFNLGMNLGRAAGAGEEHLHTHVVPRWAGDTNFMPVLADTKALPELLESTWERVRQAWPK